jgi:hypothetical protein
LRHVPAYQNKTFETREAALVADALAAPTRRRVIWGIVAKGVMFAHYLDLRGVSFEAAIDINPGKQGRFLATRTGVVAPSACQTHRQRNLVMNSKLHRGDL